MDDGQRRDLLTFARATIAAHLCGQSPPPMPKVEPAIGKCSGAFVTLHNRGRLRGCIGRFADGVDVAGIVREMAAAALGDSRFLDEPVSADELPELDIEISVLSPMKRVTDPLSLELGMHGILIRRGVRSGCFLPQVAAEQRWTKEQFLSYCCVHKAGLAPDAWKEPTTEVYLYTADVFGEKKLPA